MLSQNSSIGKLALEKKIMTKVNNPASMPHMLDFAELYMTNNY